jgi:hypothetical protein
MQRKTLGMQRGEQTHSFIYRKRHLDSAESSPPRVLPRVGTRMDVVGILPTIYRQREAV